MLFHEIQMVLPEGSIKPDLYTLKCDKDGLPRAPRSDFVISRNAEGSVVSRYGDNTWDFTPYKTTQTGASAIHFTKWIPEGGSDNEIINEAKWILFVIMFLIDSGRAGFLSVSYLCNRYPALLRDLSQYCNEEKIALRDVLSTEEQLQKYAKKLGKNKRQTLTFLISHFLRLGEHSTGYKIVGDHFLAELRTHLSFEHDQTPVIPTRIFSKIILRCNEGVNDFLKMSDPIVTLIKTAKKNKGYGLSHSKQRKIGLGAGTYKSTFKEAIDSIGLLDDFKKHSVNNLQQLSSFLTGIQLACKHLIHAYTGMRDNEVLSLKFDCLHHEKSKSGRSFRIIGETTKLLGIRKTDAWITSEDIEPAIKAAKKIALTVCKHIGIKPEDSLLFISVSYLRFTGSNPSVKAMVSPRFNSVETNFFSPSIMKEDICELEKIDPYRDWRNDEKYSIGKPWPLTSHQFRRTLAVYAAQSGLVSLPSLKRQLKHITKEMSLYYAKGAPDASRAPWQVKGHFSEEYNSIKPEADALAYIQKILLSKETLKGGHGAWVESHSKHKDREIILEDRRAIIQRFKRGEIAYSETPLGACLTTKPCEKKAMRAVSACIDCEKAAIVPSQLSLVIEAQTNLVNQLNSQSFEYMMEKEQLSDLQRMRS